MLRREPSSELFWMLGMRRSTKPRSRSQPSGTAVVMRSAKGMSSSARSVPSAAFQSPAM